MTKKQSKKHTLISSIISLVLCVAMFVGTTLAWFTDTVTNNGNRIETGTLKVKLLRYDDVASEYKDISNGTGDIFTTQTEAGENWELNGILWEPGRTEIVYLAVENAGKLPLNYNVLLNVTNDTGNQVALERALTYALVPGMNRSQMAAYGSWEQILADASETGGVPVGYSTAAPNGSLEAGKADYFALAVHMEETAGNEFQGQALTIDVKISAEQIANTDRAFAKLYVSPDGSDNNTGAADSPFRTIARAQEEVRTMNADMPGDIYVYLADGVYTLEDTLTFTPQDSGANGHYVKYVATGDAMISGGRKVEGWTKSDYENLYVAKVADFAGAGIGEMYVNDTYAERAQSKDFGLVLDQFDVDTTDIYPVDRVVVDSDVLSKASVTVGNVSDIMIRMARAWRGMVFTVEDITDNGDGTSSLHMHLTEVETGSEYHASRKDASFTVLNAFAELDEPGEFYFDETTGDLYYYPREGEVMATAEVYVSELEEIIAVEGTSLADKVENIAFENITFAHAAWYMEMEEGFYVQQAGMLYDDEGGFYSKKVTAGINLTNTNGIQFNNNVFKGFHGAAIALLSGAENTRIVGNVFEDIGDSAVVVGYSSLTADEQVRENYALNKAVTSYYAADYAQKDLSRLTQNNASGDVYWEWYSTIAGAGSLGEFTKPTLQIDLGTAQNIDNITIQVADNILAKKGFSFYASEAPVTSNVAMEANADRVGFVDTSEDPATLGTPSAFGVTETFALEDTHKEKAYRYVYFVIDDNMYHHVWNIQVNNASGTNIANGAAVTSYVLKESDTPINYAHITNDVTTDGAWGEVNCNGNTTLRPGFTKPSFQVDLGEKRSIEKIELQTSADWKSQVGHTIYASDTALASTIDIEAQADKLVSIDYAKGLAQGENQTYEVADQYKAKTYRYLYYVKEEGAAYVSGFAVYSDSNLNADAKELPKNTVITDNYITRCGLINEGAPGVTAYYTHGLDLSYNEFYDLPYSAISLGWGWGWGYLNSVASNNRVTNNIIHNVMNVMWDGGAIYTLGHLHGSEISGNYIYDVPNFSGGIYHDQGSAGLDVYNNVLENVPNAFLVSSMNNGDSSEISVHDNYISANEAFYEIHPGYYEEAVFFAPGDYPLEAVEIMRKAGIRNTYADTVTKASGRLKAQSIEDIYRNLIYSDPAIISHEIYRFYIQMCFTQYLDRFVDSVKTDGSVGSYPAALVQAVKDQRAVLEELGRASTPDRLAMAQASADMMKLASEMKESRVTDSMENLVANAEEKLANTQIGTQVGQVYQTTYDALVQALSISEAILASGEVTVIDRIYLEKCIERFDSEKVSLNVTSFDIPSGLISADIDEEKHEIHIVVRNSVDLTSVAPVIGIPSSAVITPASGTSVDLSDLTETYTVSSADGTQSLEWTVKVEKEKIFTGDIVLDEKVEDSANWITGLNTNENKYHAQLFGDSTITFNFKVNKHEGDDYPGFIFRNNVHDKGTSFASTGIGNGYTVIFNTDERCAIELQRWNNGTRTWFVDNWGVSGNPVFGEGIFKFDEENKIALTTENVEGGVYIKVEVNDQLLFEYTDISEGAVTEPGYFGTFEYLQKVTISAAD